MKNNGRTAVKYVNSHAAYCRWLGFRRGSPARAVGTLAYIAFLMDYGKILYDDQYPFLFLNPGSIFIFTGPRSFSTDQVIFNVKIDLYA